MSHRRPPSRVSSLQGTRRCRHLPSRIAASSMASWKRGATAPWSPRRRREPPPSRELAPVGDLVFGHAAIVLRHHPDVEQDVSVDGSVRRCGPWPVAIAARRSSSARTMTRSCCGSTDATPIEPSSTRACCGWCEGIVPVPRSSTCGPRKATSPQCSSRSTSRLCRSTSLAEPPDDLDWDALGASSGTVLARLSGIPFCDSGRFAGRTWRVRHRGGRPTCREFAQATGTPGGSQPGAT